MPLAECLRDGATSCRHGFPAGRRTLGRVERVEMALGAEHRIWHLNLLKHTRETLKKIG